MSHAEAQAAAVNQNALFGDEEDSFSAQDIALDAEAWSPRQILIEEKNALGFYISGHMFTAYEADARRLGCIPIANVVPRYRDAEGGGMNAKGKKRREADPWLIAGVPLKLDLRNGKRGKFMGVLLDDRSKIIEVMLYAEVLEQAQKMIQEDEFIAMWVKASFDEQEQMRYTVVSVLTFDQLLARATKGVKVTLKPNVSQQFLDSLRQLCATETNVENVEPDTAHIELHLQQDGSRAVLKLSDEWRLPISAIHLQKLAALPVVEEARWL